MKISKINNALFMGLGEKEKQVEKIEMNLKRRAVKRDMLELTEKAKKLQKGREVNFFISEPGSPEENAERNVKRAEQPSFKNASKFASRYSVGAE